MSPIPNIVAKDLSAIGRREWMYVVRAGYVVALGLAAWSVADEGRPVAWASTGRSLFVMLVGAQFILTSVLCSALAGESIAGEREAHMLLMVATVRPLHIVVGKALACIAVAGVTVAAPLPLLMMTTLYGGVSLGQVLGVHPSITGLSRFG